MSTCHTKTTISFLATLSLLLGVTHSTSACPKCDPPASAQSEQLEEQPAAGERPDLVADDPRYGLLTPLPDNGGVPKIVELLDWPTTAELAHRADVREYRKQFRIIARAHFGNKKVASIRSEGIAQLAEFTDPAAFVPMIEELLDEGADVREFVFDHLASQGDFGQAALAWAAIYAAANEGSEAAGDALQHEALSRISAPATPGVLDVLDTALRSGNHEIANNAGSLAGNLNVLQSIPLLMFAQVTNDPVEQTGDLAWILIGTQQVFVEDLNAVVGDGVVAFEPVLGTVTEGTLLRVMDAVAISYRIDIHDSLVAMTSREWGQTTAHLGYDPKKWWTWYNEEFVPHMQKKTAIATMASQSQSDGPVVPPNAGPAIPTPQ